MYALSSPLQPAQGQALGNGREEGPWQGPSAKITQLPSLTHRVCCAPDGPHWRSAEDTWPRGLAAIHRGQPRGNGRIPALEPFQGTPLPTTSKGMLERRQSLEDLWLSEPTSRGEAEAWMGGGGRGAQRPSTPSRSGEKREHWADVAKCRRAWLFVMFSVTSSADVTV